MEKAESRLTITEDKLDACFFALPKPREQICFFDIETTGLSPRVSSVYLIGAACFREGRIQLTQWFADDYTSEPDILSSFAEFVKPFSTLAHYNGAAFDIPYLETKYASFKIPSPFSDKDSLDMLQAARKNKTAFGAPDQKLSTMEKLLGFQREDAFTGRDCIQLYTEFMQKKYFRDETAAERKKSLLRHNHDDLAGTILCSQLLLYCQYTPVSPACRIQGETMFLEDKLPVPYPLRCQIETDICTVFFEENALRLEIPLYQGTLYHFYENYKDYYYLPDEDTAVHKSVGIYVDKNHREKAKASNCYTKKSGVFLPLPKGFKPEGTPLFQASRKKNLSYLPLADITNPANALNPFENKEQIVNYIKYLLC